MALSTAFNNSFSGLSVSSRRAELVSTNIANAMTEGFAKRELELSSNVLDGHGGGVRVKGIQRLENSVLTASRRGAEAEFSSVQTTSTYLSEVSFEFGSVGDKSALAVQMANLEGAFLAAANDPSNDLLLSDIVERSKNVASSLNGLSGTLNSLRLRADQEINGKVEEVNSLLVDLADLNASIRGRTAAGGSTAALKDQQGLLLDRLNEVIPIKIANREGGRVAVFSQSGGILLDGTAAEFEFTPTSVMDHSMTLAGGALSDLQVNHAPVAANWNSSFFTGGSLGALFELRDEVLPTLSENLDAIASDLITRLQDPTVDVTLSATDPGLFADDGAAFAGVNQLGVAARIGVNAVVDNDLGGDAWRLRSGLNAAAQGEVGDSQTLSSYLDALKSNKNPGVGSISTSNNSASGFSSELTSHVSILSVQLDDQKAFGASQLGELRESELGVLAVDTDEELQNLIEIENAYAANARVLKVLEQLWDRLLEI